MGKSNPVYLTFENVKVSTVAYEDMSCYNIRNANTWFDVRTLQSHSVRQYLQENGYYSPTQGKLLHTYTVDERKQLSQRLRRGEMIRTMEYVRLLILQMQNMMNRQTAGVDFQEFI